MVKRISAIIITTFLMNLLCFLYFNPLHGSDLNSYRLEPNTIGIQACEGFGIMYADENGFSNENKPIISEDYILVMGSSQSKGDQLPVDKRYSSLLNSYLGYQNELGVYNLAYNGGVFGDIVKNFEQLVSEFPNSKAVIIEVDDGRLAVNEDTFRYAIEKIEMTECVYGQALGEHDAIGKARLFVKKYCPLLLLYVNQYTSWQRMLQSTDNTNVMVPLEADAVVEADTDAERLQYYIAMLECIKEDFDNEIIVVYHNGFSLNEDNKMDVEHSAMGEDFITACEECDIVVLDMTTKFSEHFEETREVPYGFWNTSMGTGHLNKVGHKLIAEQLFEYLEGEGR